MCVALSMRVLVQLRRRLVLLSGIVCLTLRNPGELVVGPCNAGLAEG